MVTKYLHLMENYSTLANFIAQFLHIYTGCLWDLGLILTIYCYFIETPWNVIISFFNFNIIEQ